MKKSILVLSAASLAASSAVAGTYISTSVNTKDPCTVAATKAASLLTMPKTCQPEVTFYITGATAQQGFMTGTALPDRWLDAGYFTIQEGDGVAGSKLATGLKTDSSARGWYGIGKTTSPAPGKRLYVAYNPRGSIEGVMQVMSTTALETDATMFHPGSSKCVVSSSNTSLYFCGEYRAVETDLALSDVRPQEGDLVWMKAANNGKTLPKFDSSALLSTPVGIQAFALIVNNALYKALQDRDIDRKYLPESCRSEGSAGTYAVSSVTSACRPTMARQEYASLIATNGAKDLTFLFGATSPNASAKLVVDRRYGGSGTQASSNIFFLDNPCGGRGLAAATREATDGLGLNIDVTDKVISNTYGGGLIPRKGVLMSADGAPAGGGTQYGNIYVVEWVSGSTLKGTNGVGSTSTTEYHVGVAAANSDEAAGWKYLKLDGVDPFGTATGAKASTPFTDNLRNGLYPFAMVLYTVRTQAAAKKTTDILSKLAADLTDTIKVPTVDLVGIAALPGSGTTKATMDGKVSRAGNNNCAPLKVTTTP
jgi:hypothetical protein